MNCRPFGARTHKSRQLKLAILDAVDESGPFSWGKRHDCFGRVIAVSHRHSDVRSDCHLHTTIGPPTLA